MKNKTKKLSRQQIDSLNEKHIRARLLERLEKIQTLQVSLWKEISEFQSIAAALKD